MDEKNTIRKLMLMSFLGESALNITSIPLVLISLKIFDNPVLSGLIIGCEALFILLTSLFSGAIVDKFNKKNIFYISLSIGIFSSFATFVSLYLGYEIILFITIFAALNGISFSIYGTNDRAFIRTIAPRDRISHYLSLVQARKALIAILAPLSGGILYGFAEYYPFLLSFILFFSCLLISFSLPNTGVSNQSITIDFLAKGIKYVVKNSDLRLIYAYSCILTFLFTSFITLLLFHISEGSQSPVKTSFVQILLAFGLLLGSLFSGIFAKRYTIRMVLFQSIAVSSIAIYSLSLGEGPLFFSGVILSSAAFAPSGVILSTFESLVTPKSLQGRVAAAGNIIDSLLSPLSAPLAGLLYFYRDIINPFLFISIVFILISTTVILNKRISEMPKIKDIEPYS